MLMTQDLLDWEDNTLTHLFNQHTINLIKSTRIQPHLVTDQLWWTLSADGRYTTRSAYQWLSRQQASTSTPNQLSSFPTKRLMKLRSINPKHKLFIWRIVAGALPLLHTLWRRNILKTKDDRCPKCKLQPETKQHLFIECRFTKQVWAAARDWLKIEWNSQSLMEQIAAQIRFRDERDIGDIILIMWSIWKARCNLIFRSEEATQEHILHVAQGLRLDLTSAWSWQNYQQQKTSKDQPKIKIQVDAATRSNICAWAAIAISDSHKVKGIWTDTTYPEPPFQVELKAILKATELCKLEGWTSCSVESDCQQAIESLHNPNSSTLGEDNSNSYFLN